MVVFIWSKLFTLILQDIFHDWNQQVSCIYYFNKIIQVILLYISAQNPVLSHITASLQGLSTIRAANALSIMEKEYDLRQDLHSSATFTNFCSTQAFAYWVDVMNIGFISAIIFSFLLLENEISSYMSGTVGLAISSAIGLLGYCQWGMLSVSALENKLIAVERVKEYAVLKPECGLDIKYKLPKCWPDKGKISFKNVSLQYSPTSDFVLKNLNFVINSKVSKIYIFFKTN